MSRFATLGSALSPQSLATLAIETEDATGRLRRYIFQEEDGLSVLATTYRDTLLKLDCRPQEIGEGSRCLPVSAKTLDFFYSDADCSTQIQGVEVLCASEAPRFAYDGARQEVVTLASESRSVYQEGEDGCQPFAIPVLPTTAERRPYTEYAPFELVTC